jgi:hypothetical protein
MQEEARLYHVRSHAGYGFRAGINCNGLQVLVGQDWNAFVCVEFTATGDVVNVLERPYTTPSGSVIVRAPMVLTDAEKEYNRKVYEEWLAGIGLREGPIMIKRFDLAAHGRVIGISELPSYLEEYLDSPTEFDEEERAESEQALKEWKQSRDYVIWWNEEYWSHEDGHIHTS